MTDISNEQNRTKRPDSLSVGDRLRLAREEKKITIAEVAAQLRLSKEIITYLEASQWAELHGRPYARGYFSSYVNFIGLPHDEMVALFNLEYTTTAPSMDGFKRGKDKKGSLILTLSLVIIVAAAAWFAYQYWLEMQTEVEPELVNDSTIAPQNSSNPIEDSFSISIVKPIPVEENSQILSINTEEMNELAVEQMDDVTEDDSDELPDSNITDESIDSMSVQEQTVLTANTAVEQERVIESNVFILQFSQDCWVEITDQDNNKLINKIVHAGEVIELAEPWPLQVLLGNATAVTANFNKNEFDIAAHTRGNVARFSIGETIE